MRRKLTVLALYLSVRSTLALPENKPAVGEALATQVKTKLDALVASKADDQVSRLEKMLFAERARLEEALTRGTGKAPPQTPKA